MASRPKSAVVLFSALALGTLLVTTGCSKDRPEQSTRASKGAKASPRLAVQKLLASHHLLGKQPEQRTKEEKKARLDDQAVSRFFADSRDFDPFTSDVYRGFVIGALARHQTRLFIDTRGSKATVHAGDAAVIMKLEGGVWKVVLKESIPPEITDRAAQEKERFEKALKERQLPKP